MRLSLSIFVFLLIPNILSSQEVDLSKLKKIGNILCKCLQNNEGEETGSRINDCGYVLSEGLSVIGSDSLRDRYSSMADTYLQKNCKTYLKILTEENPNSDVELESRLKYEDLKNRNLRTKYHELPKGKFMYRDFVNDTIYIDINTSLWTEKSKAYGSITSFSIEEYESGTKMTFLDSNETFFRDYYTKNESVDFIFLKKDSGYRLFTRFSNGIVLSKRLWRVNSEYE